MVASKSLTYSCATSSPSTAPVLVTLKVMSTVPLYRTCTSICLASRAAIEGGLDPSTAYAMSDVYLQRLEQCKDILEITYLHSEMRLNFAKQVRQLLQNRSGISYVEKCKVYINKNLNVSFALDDIADMIKINKRYLSRIF